VRTGHLRGGQEEEVTSTAPLPPSGGGGRARAEAHPKKMQPRGIGLGLRWEFLDELLERAPTEIDFVEVSPENYMRRGGYFPGALDRVSETYPVLTHGLSMSLGGLDPLGVEYLAELRGFIANVGSPWHSDHLCFGSANGVALHDLLPIGFTEAAVARVADRVRRAQDALQVPMAIENISFYVHPGKAEMTEPEFIAAVCDRADCGLMLDVNNAYVNATNFGFDVYEWMRNVPLSRVVQMHVAGHEWFDEDQGRVIVDTHGADVCDPVFDLLSWVVARTKDAPVVLERDRAFGTFDARVAEVQRVRDAVARGAAARPCEPRGVQP
jgi:uncharacterized protein (UPF0276 family)